MGSMLKKVRFAAFGLLALGMVLPSRALAQGNPISLSLRVEGAYDDNRDGVKSGKESNFDTKVQPRIAFEYDLGRTVMGLYYMPYVLFRSDAREDQNDSELYHELGANLSHELTPIVTVKASEQFSYTDDPRVTDAAGGPRQSATYLLNLFKLGLDVQMDPTTELSLGAFSSLKRYDERVWSNYDEDKLGADLALKKEMGYQMIGSAIGRYTQSEYYEVLDRGAKFIFAGLGVSKVFSPNLAAAVDAGWNHANYNDVSGSKDLPAGSVRVILSPSPDTALTLLGRYELADSDASEYSTQERALAAVSLDHRLTPKLMAGATVMYVNGEYKSKTAMPGAVVGDGSDNLTAARVRATFSVNRNLDLELGYQFETWDSDIREDFTRNKVMLAVKASM